MCLAIPGKIKSIDQKTNHAIVSFSGIERNVNISLVEVKKGDYVVVHAGFAIQKLSRKSARKTLNILKDIVN